MIVFLTVLKLADPKTGSLPMNLKEEVDEKVMSAMKKSFRPEFLNRMDEFVVFNGLTKSALIKIVDLEGMYRKFFFAQTSSQ